MYREMNEKGFPTEVVEAIKDSIDCNIYFSGSKVGIPSMYIILAGAGLLFTALYVLLNIMSGRKNNA